MTSYLEVPLRGLAVAAFPRIGKAWKEEGATGVARLFEKTTAEMLALTLPVCLVLGLLAPWAVLFVAGPGYEDAVLLLRVLLLFALIKPWGRMFGTTLDAIGKPEINFRYVMLGVVLNVALNLLMIPWLGLVGAAYATVLATLLLVAANQWQLTRFLPVRTWQVFGDLRGAYRYWYGRLKSRYLTS
jgi:O-antigen/teichoic acid export membrane protein